jgi:hypothetical protein
MKEYDVVILGFHKTAVTSGSALYFHIKCRYSRGDAKKIMAQSVAEAYAAPWKDTLWYSPHAGYALSVDKDMLSAAAVKTGTTIEINSGIISSKTQT